MPAPFHYYTFGGKNTQMDKEHREARFFLTLHFSGYLQISTRFLLNHVPSIHYITICNVPKVIESFHKEKNMKALSKNYKLCKYIFINLKKSQLAFNWLYKESFLFSFAFQSYIEAILRWPNARVLFLPKKKKKKKWRDKQLLCDFTNWIHLLWLFGKCFIVIIT